MKSQTRAVISVLMASALALPLFSCGQASKGQPAPSGAASPAAPEVGDGEDNGGLEYYKFTYYYDNDSTTLYQWGKDVVSSYLKDKFNVDVETSRADADPESKLNLMIASGDLPDSIYMDQYIRIKRMADLGLFQPLEPLIEKNPVYNDLVMEVTRKMQVMEDGHNYLIPHWTRTKPTGGNACWMINKRLYEAAGSPELKTFEDLHAYAIAVKNDVKTTHEGAGAVPFIVDYNTVGTVINLIAPFYRAFGGPDITANWYTAVGGKLRLALRDPVYRAAVMEANKWYGEGLIGESQFSDNNDQILEKIVTGRTGLMYYDVSADDYRYFRQILIESYPDDDYIVLKDPVYPPANGLSPNKIYADHKESFGWYGAYITTKATNPQRIFDLFTYMMTQEGSINMMYGPQGELWDELDANGTPLLKMAESEISSEERERLGLWNWALIAHSDNVDGTKFAVDALLPEEKQSFVIKTQREVLTPIMYMTNEFVQIGDVIDPVSDLGIKVARCHDQISTMLPQVVMAASQDEAARLYDEILAFCDSNGIIEAEELYDAKYQDNLKMQGGTVFNR